MFCVAGAALVLLFFFSLVVQVSCRRSVCLSRCPSVRPSFRLAVMLSRCPAVSRSLALSLACVAVLLLRSVAVLL